MQKSSLTLNGEVRKKRGKRSGLFEIKEKGLRRLLGQRKVWATGQRTDYGEFDPGSGLTLAGGLIHASRTGNFTSVRFLVAHG